MGVFKGIVSWIEAAGSQLTHTINFWRYEPDKREIHFSNNFQHVAHERGLTEADALDVYYHGYVIKDNMMERKYNGYEIGIYYFVAHDTGRIVITSIWKRGRR
jgi:hypothetical protein